MPNSFFKFKQFTIRQEQAGMKVTTDACLFAAYVARYATTIQGQELKQVLDIGAGTGLLSLMLAQALPNSTKFTAVEYEEGAYKQCVQNINNSPWASRMKVEHSPIQDYLLDSSEYFSLIISNPPFFANQLASPHTTRHQARHQDSLTLKDLCSHSIRLLEPKGCFWALLPVREQQELAQLMEMQGHRPVHSCEVHHSEDKPALRKISCYQRVGEALSLLETRRLFIYEESYTRNYTQQFIDLLKSYYLYL